jgi:hypothetical protein
LPFEAVGWPLGVGARFDDVPAEGETIDDRGAEHEVGEGSASPANDSLLAIATEFFSSAFAEDLEERFGAAAVELHV